MKDIKDYLINEKNNWSNGDYKNDFNLKYCIKVSNIPAEEKEHYFLGEKDDFYYISKDGQGTKWIENAEVFEDKKDAVNIIKKYKSSSDNGEIYEVLTIKTEVINSEIIK